MLKPYVSNMLWLKTFQSLDAFEWVKILRKRFIVSRDHWHGNSRDGLSRLIWMGAKIAQISKLQQMFLASPDLMSMNSCTDRQEQMRNFEELHFHWFLLVAKWWIWWDKCVLSPSLKLCILLLKCGIIFTEELLSFPLIFLWNCLLNNSVFHHQNGGNEINHRSDWSPMGPHRSSFASQKTLITEGNFLFTY